ncbi:unnamed protein product [Clonostachys rhizophaga]|uniref:Uncharacterized protein n=1 Tax=Clonostachys rhizophaga TaxID=160324 RepID=A0A9N9YNJ0_9HYPO|nr:unnamed protein product [Clonostachys rhizophaga]
MGLLSNDQIDLARLPRVRSKEDWFDQDALLIEAYIPIHYLSTAIAIIGFGLFTLLDENSSAGTWIGFQIIEAIGMGVIIPTFLPAILAPLTDADTGFATGTWSFFRSFSIAWGTAIPAAISNNRFDEPAGNTTYIYIEHYLCDMMLVLQRMGGFPVEDELFRAIFLDINRLTEQSFLPKFEQMKAEMDQYSCDIEEYTRVMKELVHLSSDGFQTALASHNGVREHVKSFTDDKVFQEKKRISKLCNSL